MFRTLSIILLISTSCGKYIPNKFELDHQTYIKVGRKVSLLSSKRNISFTKMTDSAPNGSIALRRSGDEQHMTWLAFDTSQMADVSEGDLTNHALDYLESHDHLFRVSIQELKPTSKHIIHLKDNLISVNFERSFKNMVVRDAFVELIYLKDPSGSFRLREITNQSFGAIKLQPPSKEANISSYLDSKGYDIDKISSQSRFILARKDSGGALKFHFASSAEIVFEDYSYTMTFVDGESEPVEVYAHQYHLEGSIKGRGFLRNYKEDTTPFFMPHTEIETADKTILTDGDGLYQTISPVDGHIMLSGKRAYLVDDLTKLSPKIPVSLNGDDIVIGDNPSEIKAINAYTALQRINLFARRFISLPEDGFLDRPANIVINVDGACNAFYDTGRNSLNFFSQGEGCADTALINDIIYHEWGHGLDFYTGRTNGITDAAFSEGIGDIIANFYTESSMIGQGLILGENFGIRDANNKKRFPEDQGPAHEEGQIIAGAFWDLLQAMIDRYGPRRGKHLAAELFFRHLLTADSYHESYLTVLRLDDDDGNPNTRSPNHCLINRAFASHGLAELEECEDVPRKSLPPVADLNIAIREMTDKGVKLMVSSEVKVDRVGLCIGDAFRCLTTPAQDGELQAEGSRDQGRVIYSSPKELPLKELSKITAFTLNDNGEVSGYRTFVLATK